MTGTRKTQRKLSNFLGRNLFEVAIFFDMTLEEEYSVKENLYFLMEGFKKYAVDPDIKNIPEPYIDAFTQLANYYDKKYDADIQLWKV